MVAGGASRLVRYVVVVVIIVVCGRSEDGEVYVLPEEVDVGDCVVLLFGDSFLERGLVLFSVFVSVLIVFGG